MLYYLVTAVISVSAGVIGMGVFCGRKIADAVATSESVNELCETVMRDYATERRKRLDAEQAHTDLADKHNLALGKLEAIRSIPNNGKKPNGGLLKAQRIAGAV